MGDAEVESIQRAQSHGWQAFYHEFRVDHVLVRHREVKQVSVAAILLKNGIKLLYLFPAQQLHSLAPGQQATKFSNGQAADAGICLLLHPGGESIRTRFG